MAQPRFILDEIKMGFLDETMLYEVLYALPIDLEIKKGHEMPLIPETEPSLEDAVMIVNHAAQLISIKPPKGFRLSECLLIGESGIFRPSRVMDEYSGGGCCSSYDFNPVDLGLPYDIYLTLDIYKLGF